MGYWRKSTLFEIEATRESDRPPLVLTIIVLPLLVFWAWMFREMLNNDYLLPQAKNFWTLAFIFCSILAAAYYYTNVYRSSQ